MSDRFAQIPDAILDGQWQSWMEGKTPSIEELLEGTPFQDSSEAQLDLVYNEIVVKEKLGLQPREDEYLTRFPHLKEELKLHFEIHRAVIQRLVVDTVNALNESTWHESNIIDAESDLSVKNYAVIRALGQGGMAVVYEARHRQLQRSVALKMFRPGCLLFKRDLFRIRTEAEAIARLDHPHILQIYEIGECQGTPFLALELAEQGNLCQKLLQFPFTPEGAAKLVETLARAVQHAHERQVIHRDLVSVHAAHLQRGGVKVLGGRSFGRGVRNDRAAARGRCGVRTALGPTA